MITVTRPSVPQQPEKRKFLIRSTASYNHLDQLQNVLVAPTPRKLASMPSSPTAKRKSSEHETVRSLFGEAGLELQTILLQCLGEVSCTEESGKQLQQQQPAPVAPIVNLCHSDDEERETTKIPRLVEMERPPSPPLRSSNPIIQNSEFARQQEEESTAVEEIARPHPRLIVQPVKKVDNLKPKKDKLQLRIRSASWPGPTTTVSS